MTLTGDQTYIKNLNRSIVLNLIRFASPLSRVEISRRTGLTKATVSAIVDLLIQEKYVTEIGLVSSGSVGRRPVSLCFNPDVGRVIGVDVGVDYYRVLVLNLSGTVVDSYEDTPVETDNAADVIRHISQMIKQAIKEAVPSELGVIGVGIGIPGLIDAKKGTVLNAPNLHWQDIPLGSMLKAELGLPVIIDNEANAGAIGEQLFGAGQGISNMVFLSLGRGIGTGIILNGHLVRGEAGIAGEFGHMTIDLNGDQCSCGNRGCLEQYASERAVIEKYKQLTGESLPFVTIIKRMEKGDPAASQAIESAAYYLGVGISSLVNGLNPKLILVSSRYGAVNDSFIDMAVQTIQERSFINPYSPAQVRASAFGPLSCAIGAASLVLQTHFAGPR